MLRSIGIWLSGLISFTFVGGLVGKLFDQTRDHISLPGAVAGAATFVFLRLLLTSPKRVTDQT
jgi:hypothetical protein